MHSDQEEQGQPQKDIDDQFKPADDKFWENTYIKQAEFSFAAPREEQKEQFSQWRKDAKEYWEGLRYNKDYRFFNEDTDGDEYEKMKSNYTE